MDIFGQMGIRVVRSFVFLAFTYDDFISARFVLRMLIPHVRMLIPHVLDLLFIFSCL